LKPIETEKAVELSPFLFAPLTKRGFRDLPGSIRKKYSALPAHLSASVLFSMARNGIRLALGTKGGKE